MIELLVVVAMLSVLAVGVTLPLRQTADPARADALLFQSVYTRVRAQAVHGRSPRGLKLEARGLRVMQPLTASSSDQFLNWQMSDHHIAWQGRVVLQSKVGSAGGAPLAPDIIFLPNGQTSAFEVRLSGGRTTPPVLCRSDGWSEMSCDLN